MANNQDEIIKGAVIALAGFFAIRWTFMQPCNVPVNPSLGVTAELARLVCFSTDLKIMVVSTIGLAALFTGVSRIFKSV